MKRSVIRSDPGTLKIRCLGRTVAIIGETAKRTTFDKGYCDANRSPRKHNGVSIGQKERVLSAFGYDLHSNEIGHPWSQAKTDKSCD